MKSWELTALPPAHSMGQNFWRQAVDRLIPVA